MKNFSWVLLLSLLSITLSVNAQTDNEDFCRKYPLNSICKQDNSPQKTNSSRDNLERSDSNIVDTLTLDEIEKYLREIGYVSINRLDDFSLTVMMQGRLCNIIMAKNGKGMSIGSYFPKEENMTLEVLNDWNKSLRYSFAFLYTTKKDKEWVILETNLTVTGGVTSERIKSFFRLHTDYQTYFSQYLNQL